MTKSEFKKRWESDDTGGGITVDDIADCAQSWGIIATPRVKPLAEVVYQVLKAANVKDVEEYNLGIVNARPNHSD